MIASHDAHNHDVLPENIFVDSLSAGRRIFEARSDGMFEIARSVLPLLAHIPRARDGALVGSTTRFWLT